MTYICQVCVTLLLDLTRVLVKFNRLAFAIFLAYSFSRAPRLSLLLHHLNYLSSFLRLLRVSLYCFRYVSPFHRLFHLSCCPCLSRLRCLSRLHRLSHLCRLSCLHRHTCICYPSRLLTSACNFRVSYSIKKNVSGKSFYL